MRKEQRPCNIHLIFFPRVHIYTHNTAPDVAGATSVSSSTAAPAAPQRPAIASVGPNCVKQGYLWKRSSNVLKDWKRRFFFIRVRPRRLILLLCVVGCF